MSTYRRLLYLPIKDGSVCQGPSLNKGFNKIDQKVKRAVCTSRSAGRLILHLFSSEPQAESWNFWPFSSPGNKGFELTPGEHANSKNLWFLRWKACLLTLLQRRSAGVSRKSPAVPWCWPEPAGVSPGPGGGEHSADSFPASRWDRLLTVSGQPCASCLFSALCRKTWMLFRKVVVYAVKTLMAFMG